MAIQERVLSLVAKIVRVISLKNVALWSLAGVLALVGLTAFQNRTAIVSYIINGPTVDTAPLSSFTVSAASQSRIKSLVDSDDLINAMVVLNADIRNNRRVPIHWYSDDPSAEKALDSLFSGKYGGIPLFTSDEKNNEGVVGVINGEFTCSEYTAGGNAALFPSMQSRFPYVCRTSLPPYYGQFSGYITICLNRVPSADELINLKTEALNISTEIYFRDVLPSSKKVNPTNPANPAN